MVKCPECNEDIRMDTSARMAYCSGCGSTVIKHGNELAAGQKMPPVAETPGRFSEAGSIIINGTEYEICGVLRFISDDNFWDDWQLLTQDGKFHILSEGEDEYALLDEIRDLPLMPSPVMTYEGNTIIEGRQIEVYSSGKAVFAGIRGQSPGIYAPLEEIRFIKGVSGRDAVWLIWHQDRIMLAKGTLLRYKEIKLK